MLVVAGPLPEDWYQLPLEEIRLDQNVIEGELPAAWFGEGPLSGSLRVLTLWDNKLTGTLPGTQGGMQVGDSHKHARPYGFSGMLRLTDIEKEGAASSVGQHLGAVFLLMVVFSNSMSVLTL